MKEGGKVGKIRSLIGKVRKIAPTFGDNFQKLKNLEENFYIY